MTTVVIHDNKVYADGQSTSTMITSYNVKKIVNIGKAILVGAGRYAHVCKFHDWAAEMIEAGHAQEVFPHVNIGMPEKMVDDDFLGAILYPDGTVVLFEGCDNYYEVEQPVFLGSGSDYAAGAIHAGADGITAIEVAIKLDPYTGGEIQVEGFEDEPEPFTKEQMSAMSKDEILAVIFGEDDSGVVPTLGAPTSDTPVADDVYLNMEAELRKLSPSLVEFDYYFAVYGETGSNIDLNGAVVYDKNDKESEFVLVKDLSLPQLRECTTNFNIPYKPSHSAAFLRKQVQGFVDKVVAILNQK